MWISKHTSNLSLGGSDGFGGMEEENRLASGFPCNGEQLQNVQSTVRLSESHFLRI